MSILLGDFIKAMTTPVGGSGETLLGQTETLLEKTLREQREAEAGSRARQEVFDRIDDLAHRAEEKDGKEKKQQDYDQWMSGQLAQRDQNSRVLESLNRAELEVQAPKPDAVESGGASPAELSQAAQDQVVEYEGVDAQGLALAARAGEAAFLRDKPLDGDGQKEAKKGGAPSAAA
jgi:hypothetical protein